MVLYSLVVMGTWLGLLSINVAEGSHTMRSFSAVLLISAAVIRHFIRRQPTLNPQPFSKT